jgi:hypothetical protein
MSLADYIKFCCTGKLPDHVRTALSKAAQDPVLKALLCTAEIIGGLEPLAATRPGVCDPAIHHYRRITVPAATIVNGVLIPGEERVISFCAPINRALVVEKSRVKPFNDVAAAQPVAQPLYKKVNLGTFGEWCLPFEPLDAAGSFNNIEHIIVPAGGGYSVYVQNHVTTGAAIYEYEARFWASC